MARRKPNPQDATDDTPEDEAAESKLDFSHAAEETGELPELGSGATATAPEAAPPSAAEPEHIVHWVTIRVPLAAPLPYPEGGSQSRLQKHIDLQNNATRAEVTRHLWHGLDLENARLGSRERVTSQTQAVYWLLEQIALAVPEGIDLPALKVAPQAR